MPARRLLPLLALGLAAACGRGADSTGAATTTSTLPAGPGVHDHTPHHGGVVGMAGDLHLEALAAPDGRVRVYLTDFWRRPLPAASATGTVTLELPDRDRALPLAVAGDALEGSGPALYGAEVTAHVALSVGGKAVEMDFVLPVGAGGAGAAGVPVHGCVALAGSPGAARAPRCTLDFAHPVTVVAATPDGALALVAAVDLGVSVWRLPAGQLTLAFAGGRLLAGGTDGVLRVFDAESGALVAEGPPGTGITRLAAAPGAGLVASAHNDGSVRVSTLPDATVVTTLAWHTHQLLGLAWAGSVLVSGDTAGHVALWDVGDLVAGRF